ncbi:MAG TPA: hypothetical protein DEF18_11100 [Muricauda sp.]|uniref:Uncharacterized protein n=1 Tax=Flagellimonas aurea TaxID=2915619 RepID=A0ABS3G580_9FLAO|nr:MULTISPECIES: hypothetical protein [Allomuricauda]MAO16640.1 hypothetical protein [Allomuricauda sp.]UBZ12669.1 hypothetical protein LDL77_12290 [Allomuricauda aquimarina]HAI44708.1 hypothetical protein [Maribacter sp.]MBO0354577.1 hypothetical protein [Allomuricauda aurea]HBU78636.1 hypothetical protein [Allomuricauda sp.]|tara:strand:- start:1702 stop:1920 length:219 start_codon:yes stop_codon:yes gene_type:complete
MTESERKFLDLFEDAYASPLDLAKELELGIDMLFYLEEGVFLRREIQNVAAALRGISTVLKSCDWHEPRGSR